MAKQAHALRCQEFTQTNCSKDYINDNELHKKFCKMTLALIIIGLPGSATSKK